MIDVQQKIPYINDQFSEFAPMRILEIDLEHPLPIISAFDEKKQSYYHRASCLVRLHTQPLGIIDIIVEGHILRPDEYIEKIWDKFHTQINEHLEQDNLSPVAELTIHGLPNASLPLCIEEREDFLKNAPFVSIVVPTHGRPEQLAICLSSLISLQYPHYEIVVVDNAPSTNATAELIRDLSKDAPFIRYVCENNPGRSWARNRGIATARGEILAFTDDDVLVDPYWLVELVRGFGFAENVACVTGLVLPMELDTPAQFLFEEYGGFNKGYTRRIFEPFNKGNRYPDIPLYPFVPGRFGTGASMAFTSDFLRKVGGFDPALGGSGRSINGQDIALFLQVILDGYTLVYQPRALLHHLHRRKYIDLCKQIYHYGISLTGLLTKVIIENPSLLFSIIAKVPYGLFFILSSQSSKNSKRSEHYPKELVILERKGMLYGPLAYILSQWEVRELPKLARSK